MVTLSYKELKAVANITEIKDYRRMTEYELLKAFEESEKPKTSKNIKEIRRENNDNNEIIRDLRALYESEEDYYELQKTKGGFNDDYIEYGSNGDRDKRLSIQEYLNMVRPYLSNIIDDHKDTSTMHIENQNIITLTGYEADDIIEKLFESLLEKYQQGLEEKLKKVTMLLIVLMHCIINFIKQG